MTEQHKVLVFFLRLPVAISILGHGLVRLPKLQAFSSGMVQEMEASFLPAVLVSAFGYFLPFAEAIIGAWLFSGYKLKYSLYSGLALMSVLVFGSCSIENWGAIGAQLIHSLYFFALLWIIEFQINKQQ